MPVGTRAAVRRPGRLFIVAALVLVLGAGIPLLGAEPLTGDARPVRLVLPSIGVDAPIETLNLEQDGGMPAPERGDVVAWYSFSASAGGPGNAVLAGHVDWEHQRGAFYDLDRLQEGDEVWLQAAEGTWALYRVIWSVSLADDSAPVEAIVGPTAWPSVTLITCSGAFDRNVGRYTERRILRAELDSSAS